MMSQFCLAATLTSHGSQSLAISAGARGSMSFARRGASLLVVSASLALCACSSERLAVHQVVLAQGEAEGPSACGLLRDEGPAWSLGDPRPWSVEGDYRVHERMGDGTAAFRFFIRAEPGQEAAQPLGKLALPIDLQRDSFGRGSARLDHFETRAGVRYAVYTWAEADCAALPRSPPQWVLDKVAVR